MTILAKDQSKCNLKDIQLDPKYAFSSFLRCLDFYSSAWALTVAWTNFVFSDSADRPNTVSMVQQP